MATDISPELYEAIKVNFNTAAATDLEIPDKMFRFCFIKIF